MNKVFRSGVVTLCVVILSGCGSDKVAPLQAADPVPAAPLQAADPIPAYDYLGGSGEMPPGWSPSSEELERLVSTQAGGRISGTISTPEEAWARGTLQAQQHLRRTTQPTERWAMRLLHNEFLAGLKELDLSDELHLSVWSLSDDDFRANLEKLSLAGTSFSDVEILFSLTSLRELNLYETQLSPEDITSLREALPGCEIHTEPEVDIFDSDHEDIYHQMDP